MKLTVESLAVVVVPAAGVWPDAWWHVALAEGCSMGREG